MPRRWETFVVLEWRSKLTRKIRDCARQRGNMRMHYLSPLLRKLLGRVTKHCILERKRKRKRDIWISNRGARSFCSVKKKMFATSTAGIAIASRACALSENLRVRSIISQRLILFVRAASSGTALLFIRKREWDPGLLNNYYIPDQACPVCIAFTRSSSHSWARSVVRVMIDRY